MRNTFDKLDRDLNSTLWLPVLGLALAAAVAAGCGGDSTGSPGGGGSGGSSGGTAGNSAGGNSGGGTTGSGGTSGSGVAGTTGNGGNGSGGNSTAGTGGSSTAGAGGNTGAGGNSTAGSGGNAGGSGGTAGNGGGGTTGGAQAGRGGASAGSGGASAGAGGRGGSGGTTGTGGTTTGCPTNATFCSGFDTSAMPAGAIYMVNAAPGEWTRDFAIDTAVKNSGASSLRVKSASGDTGTSGSAYKMLAVPATQGAFWVRFFMRSDATIGMAEHNVFAGASTGNSPNDGLVEFAEDVGVSFNTSDDVRWPTGYGRLSGGGTMPYSLPANMWHCIEISFDGTGRVQQLFVGGTQLINATGYPAAARAFTFFKFGFNQLHGPARSLWYDDVAVAPARVGGCN